MQLLNIAIRRYNSLHIVVTDFTITEQSKRLGNWYEGVSLRLLVQFFL
jgi:hypothetical protein